MAEQEIKISVVTEGAEEASSSFDQLKNALDQSTSSLHLNTQASEENEQATISNTASTVRDILKREEARQVAERLTGTVANLAKAIGDASKIQDENQRNTALMRSGWDAVTGAVTAFNPVIGGAMTAVTAGVDAFNQWQEAQERLRQTMDSLTRQTESLGVNIETVTIATNNLIDAQRLMQTVVNANNAGLQLNTNQLQDIVEASQRYASTSGREVNEVFDEMSQALISRNIPKLREFGLVTNDVTDGAQAQAQAMEEISGGFTRINRSVEENIQALRNAGVEQNALTIAINAAKDPSFQLSHAQERIVENVNRANAAINEQANVALRAQAQAARESEEAILSYVATQQAAAAAIASLSTLPGANVPTIEEEIAAREAARRSRGGGSAREEEEWDPAAAFDRARSQAEEATRLLAEMAIEEEEILRINQEKEILQSEALFARERESAEMARQAEIAASLADKERERLALEQQRQAQQERLNQGVERYNNFQTLGVQIAQTALHDGRKAAKTQLKEWLKSFAIKEALEGGKELAMGIGSSIINPPAAAAHYASAGKHFALAAAAGGGAGALSGGGGGGKGKASSESAKPTNQSASASAQGETVVININGQSLLTQGQIGREISNALSTYQSRY